MLVLLIYSFVHCSHALEAPGIAVPSVCCVDVDPAFKYLILMSDGVYKTIESLPHSAKQGKGEQQLLSILQAAMECNARDFTKVAEHILNKISSAHEHTYHQYASNDPRSPEAVQCRKRDDMALIVYQFGAS